jgi:hypothetical protein
MGMEPTPLPVDKIGAILTAGIYSTAFPIYRCGAAKRQPVGRLSIQALLAHHQENPAMDRFIEGLEWGVLIAVTTLFNWQGWIILGTTGIIPLLARWRRPTDMPVPHPIPPNWELWLSLSAPFILASVRAFLLPPLGFGPFTGRPVVLPVLLVIWGLELLLLWRHRHRGLRAWIVIAGACLWSRGVYVTSTCTLTVVCQPFP